MNPPSSPTVACLGPEGSFSHEFALAHFGQVSILCIEPNFEDVISKVQDGTCSHAVLPLLNSSGVSVKPVQTALGKHRDSLRVEGCFLHYVYHSIVAGPHFSSLKMLLSKEQVFPQCSKWFEANSGVMTQEAPSTSAALKQVLELDEEAQRSTAAICNKLAHNLYGGTVIESNIQNPNNQTLFLVVSLTPPKNTDEQLLVCLTCPTDDCYQRALEDFGMANFPVKFSSMKGNFSAESPLYLQLANEGNFEDFLTEVGKPHRTWIGSFSTEESLSSCVERFFDDDLLDYSN